MRDTNGKWQKDSTTWFLGLAERRDLFLPGFGNLTITLMQGDVAVLFANTWHAGVAEQAGADGSEVLFGYFDRATNFSAADAKFEVGPGRSSATLCQTSTKLTSLLVTNLVVCALHSEGS